MANLSGMFEQLNAAVLGNPLAGDAGGKLLSGFSQGMGQVGGAVSGALGAPVDPMSFMTSDAKKDHAEDQLGKLDLQTAEGLAQASKLYAQMGDVAKATQLAGMAGTKRTQQVEALEASGVAATQEAQRKRGMAMALSNGDQQAYQAIEGGLLTAGDYAKTLFQSKVKIQETVAGRDPYAGAFTSKEIIGGKEFQVRRRSNGDPIAILGEGRNHFDLKEMYDPVSGTSRMAAVDKLEPGKYQFVEAAEAAQPSYDIKEVDGKFHVWMTPPGGGAPQRVAVQDSLTDAEKDMAEAKSAVKTVNLMSSIDQAIGMIDSDAKVGGWYGPLEYIPESAQRSFNALLDSVRSNVGFESLANLRAEGGTLGQVSNIENMLLQSEVAKLDGWTDKRDVKKSLQKIRNISERIHVAETTGNPDTLMVAEKDPKTGMVTGNMLYDIDEDTLAVVYPDGQIEIKLTGQ